MPEAFPKPAGQPFTLGGVARYAQAKPGRLAGVALVFALVSGISVAALFARGWLPAVREAVANLPEKSLIVDGMLLWPENRGRLLSASPFVSFSAGLNEFELGNPGDVAVVFGAREMQVRSLLGAAAVPYPRGWTVELNRTVLAPIWGAWEQVLVPLVAFGAAFGLLFTWSMLAVPYTVILRFFALVLGKHPSFGELWKMGVAAQWPGALLMTFFLTLYALGQTTLVLLLGVFGAHFALTLLYLVFAPICLPKPAVNPFRPNEAGGRGDKKRANPFGD